MQRKGGVRPEAAQGAVRPPFMTPGAPSSREAGARVRVESRPIPRGRERDMSQENVDLVTGGYDDFNSGNVEGVTARFHPEIEWIEPGGGNAPAGTFKGPDSVANDVFATVPANFDEFTCTVEDASDQGDVVVVTARFKGRNKSGAELDARQSMFGRFATARSRGSRTRSTKGPGPRVGAERTGAGRARSVLLVARSRSRAEGGEP